MRLEAKMFEYKGLTYDGTKPALWGTMDKLAALQEKSEEFAGSTKPVGKKVGDAIKSLTSSRPEEGNKPNPDGVKESGCGRSSRGALKRASYVLDQILSKKKVATTR